MPKVLAMKAAFSFRKGYIFDRMYFVKNEEEGIIPRIFPVCMQMRIQGPNLDSLRNAVIDVVKDEEGREVCQGLKITRDQAPENLPLVADFQKALKDKDLKSWWCVVPILLHSVKDTAGEPEDEDIRVRSRLSYLRIKSWDTSRSRDLRYGRLGKPDIPDSATLHVGGEKISPPCLACPHLSRHMSGGCVLGMTTCLTSMGVVHKSQFVKNLEKYGKEVLDASVQADDTPSN